MLFFSSSTASFAANPDWFLNQNISPQNNYSYIGYGAADSLHTAKQIAREDIATQLHVKIDVTTESDQLLDDRGFRSSTHRKSRQKASASLMNVSLIKSEFNDEQFYVAMSYQHISFIQHFSNKLNKKNCENEIQHAYLSHTVLFETLNAKLPCKYNIELLRQNNAWMLNYKNVLVELSEKNFSDLYADSASNGFEMSSHANRLVEGQSFGLGFLSDKTGYITLFNVYGAGIVSLLQSNIVIKANKMRRFPTERDELIFEAALLKPGVESLELYVGLFSPTKNDYTQYMEANESSFEGQKQFVNLLALMQNQSFATVLLRVSPK